MFPNARKGSCLRSLLTGAAVLAGVGLSTPAAAIPVTLDTAVSADLSRLSLEELANVEIISVSKRPERLGQAPAAVYVIGGEDIRRSAAISLPEALRLAPNLQVARVDAADYAISARGFNGYETSNKLLVMIDGRSIYTPFHSGVLWDAHQVMLDDLQRIEVVSGPGGTLWGANAVNGVVNIISKSAADTQGLLVNMAGGELDRTGSVRYGGMAGEAVAWRAYVTGFDRRDTLLPNGAEAGDGWQGGQTGFRTDIALAAGGLTVQGDAYYDRHDDGGRLNGGNLLARWNHEFAGGSTLQAQAYFDKADRFTPSIGGVVPSIEEAVDTLDLQVQQALPKGRRHQLVWGAGYRVIDDLFIVGPGHPLFNFLVDPPERRLTLGNVFVQDEIQLTGTLSLTVGLKLEDSSYSGLEYLPNARLAWQLSETTLVWGAVSRAVRTPSRVERDLVWPGIIDRNTFGSESVIAYEAGFRAQPMAQVSLSVSAFFNDYDDLRTNEARTPPAGPRFVGNGQEGQNWGLEAWGGYDVTDAWRLSAGVSLLGEDYDLKPEVADDYSIPPTGGDDPEHQILLRSQSNHFDRLEVDLMLRAVGELPNPAVDSYVELDARLGWRLTEEAEVYLAGVNLLNEDHQEEGEPEFDRFIRRSVHAGLRWRF